MVLLIWVLIQTSFAVYLCHVLLYGSRGRVDVCIERENGTLCMYERRYGNAERVLWEGNSGMELGEMTFEMQALRQ